MKTQIVLLALLALFSITISAKHIGRCHPFCRWDCEKTRCDVKCTPKCTKPVCTSQCSDLNNANCHIECSSPECTTVCPNKWCELNHCPECKIQCLPSKCDVKCTPPKAECHPVCNQPTCSWDCHYPTAETCKSPKCTLKCEHPSCIPQTKCCPCTDGGKYLSVPKGFWVEDEKHQVCCECPVEVVKTPIHVDVGKKGI